MNDEKMQAGREKYWNELTSDMKIERTREVVWQLRRSVHDLERKIALLNEHQHDKTGKLTVLFCSPNLLIGHQVPFSPVGEAYF